MSEEVFPTCSWSISCGSLNFILLQLLMHLTVQTILAQSEEPRYSSNSSLVFPCVSCAVSHFYVFEKWQTGLQNQDKSRSFGLPGHSNLATATWPRSCDAIERAWGLGDPAGPCCHGPGPDPSHRFLWSLPDPANRPDLNRLLYDSICLYIYINMYCIIYLYIF